MFKTTLASTSRASLAGAGPGHPCSSVQLGTWSCPATQPLGPDANQHSPDPLSPRQAPPATPRRASSSRERAQARTPRPHGAHPGRMWTGLTHHSTGGPDHEARRKDSYLICGGSHPHSNFYSCSHSVFKVKKEMRPQDARDSPAGPFIKGRPGTPVSSASGQRPEHKLEEQRGDTGTNDHLRDMASGRDRQKCPIY